VRKLTICKKDFSKICRYQRVSLVTLAETQFTDFTFALKQWCNVWNTVLPTWETGFFNLFLLKSVKLAQVKWFMEKIWVSLITWQKCCVQTLLTSMLWSKLRNTVLPTWGKRYFLATVSETHSS